MPDKGDRYFLTDNYSVLSSGADINGIDIDNLLNKIIIIEVDETGYIQKSALVIISKSDLNIPTYTLNYGCGDNGSLTGDTTQTVYEEDNGTTVTASPNAGYHFAGWSDGVDTAERTDYNVYSDINVTANFDFDFNHIYPHI